MNARVTGLAHSVLLAMNVILVKDCEESNSPTPRKFTFFLNWNFFWNNYDIIRKESYYTRLQENEKKECQILQSRLLEYFGAIIFIFLADPTGGVKYVLKKFEKRQKKICPDKCYDIFFDMGPITDLFVFISFLSEFLYIRKFTGV